MPGALAAAGYATHASGKIHLNPGGLTQGFDVDDLDPAAYPEAAALWRSGRIRELPLPYYGLESVDYLGGCAHSSYGPYLEWLAKVAPEHLDTVTGRKTLEPPTHAADLFNRNSYKWALPERLHPASWVADRAIDYLTRRDGRPFMLICSFQEPHRPNTAGGPCHGADPIGRHQPSMCHRVEAF